jgi:hypothetical protein
MFEDMKFPLFFFEDDDLLISDSIEEAENFFDLLEDTDSISGFDSDGRKVLFKYKKPQTTYDRKYPFHSIEEDHSHQEEFIIKLKKYLSKFNQEGVFYSGLTQDELVSIAIECYHRLQSPKEKFGPCFQTGLLIFFAVVLCGLLYYLLVLMENQLFR